MDVSKSVSWVCACDECGDKFGEDGRSKRYINVIPMPINLEREEHRKEVIQDLQRQLKEARLRVKR